MHFGQLISALALAFVSLAAAAQENVRPEEIVITGKVQGPPLWQVRHGDHVLWIFGLLSPVPPGLELDTTRIDRVLVDTDEVLGQPDLDFEESFGPVKLLRLYAQFRKMRVNDDGKTLQQVLPADVYQRLLAASETYGPRGNKLMKMRPLMAAELLEREALDSVGLKEDTGGITKQLRRLIRRHDVPFTDVAYVTDISVSSMMDAMDDVPLEDEIACLRSLLTSLDDDLNRLKDRAEAWAYGQLGELYAANAYGGAKASCFQALTTSPALQALSSRTSALWLDHAERALGANRNTFALLDIHLLLDAHGVLETLRTRGYEVIEPM